MAGHALFLGIDITRDGFRGLAIDSDGKTFCSAHASLTSEALRETDAVWTGFCEIVERMADALGGEGLEIISALGFSGESQGGFYLSEDDEPVAPGTLRGDKEAQGYSAYLEATARRSRAISGNIAEADMIGPGLLYLREESPELFKSCRLALSHKDYLIYRLTGLAVTDPTSASGTALFDPMEGQWASRILSPLGLSADLLPKVAPCDSVAGVISEDAAKVTGLPRVPVILGAAQPMALAGGLGLNGSGQGVIDLTGAASLVCLNDIFLPHPLREVSARAFVRDEIYAQLMVLGEAARFYDWPRSLSFSGVTRPDGPDATPYFLPGLEHGAVLAGVQPDTAPDAIAIAIRTGFAFTLSEAVNALADLTPLADELYLNAPQNIAKAWGPYLASCLDKDLLSVEEAEFGAARGAALLARKAHLGLSDGEAFPPCPPHQRYHRDPELAAHFQTYRPGLVGLKSRLTQA